MTLLCCDQSCQANVSTYPPTRPQKAPISSHCTDRWHISSYHHTPRPIQCTEIITNMTRPTFIDPAKLQRLIVTYRRMPQIELQEAMKLANFSPDEVSDIAYRRCVQRSLPGGSIKAFRASMSGDAAPPLNRNERHETRHRRERTPPPKRTPPPHRATPTSGRRSRGTSA